MKIDKLNIMTVEMDLEGLFSKQDVLNINEVCNRAEDHDLPSLILIKLNSVKKNDDVSEKIDVRLINQWERALRRIEQSCAITIAAIESDCNGFAMAVTLCTDYRIAMPGVKFSMSAMNGSILPGTIIHRLVNELGVAKARRLALLGLGISAHTAEQISIIDEVSDNMENSIDSFIRLLNENNIRDFSLRRKLLLEAPSISYEDALGVHLAACDRTLRNKYKQSFSSDQEAIEA